MEVDRQTGESVITPGDGQAIVEMLHAVAKKFKLQPPKQPRNSSERLSPEDTDLAISLARLSFTGQLEVSEPTRRTAIHIINQHKRSRSNGHAS